MDETYDLKPMAQLFQGYTLPPKRLSRQPKHEYEFFISQASKLLKERYFVTHSRISKAFEGKTPDYILSHIRTWYYTAEKSDNPGKVFNGMMKKYREVQS